MQGHRHVTVVGSKGLADSKEMLKLSVKRRSVKEMLVLGDVVNGNQEQENAEHLCLGNTILYFTGRGSFVLNSNHQKSVVKKTLQNFGEVTSQAHVIKFTAYLINSLSMRHSDNLRYVPQRSTANKRNHFMYLSKKNCNSNLKRKNTALVI